MDKRLYAGILLVILFVMLLAACGGDPAAPGSTADPGFIIITATPRETATPTVTPTPEVPVLDAADLSGIEIELWYASDPTSPDLIADLIVAFNNENEYGIQAAGQNLEFPNDLDAEVLAAAETGDLPEVALARRYQYLSWWPAVKIVEPDPYMDTYPHESKDEIYPRIFFQDTYPKGRLAFPGLFSAQVMLYNQTWAEELGFSTAPLTPAAFQRQACAAHQANGDRTGGWLIDSSPEGAAAWLLSFDPGLGQLLDFKSSEVEASYTFLSTCILKAAHGIRWSSIRMRISPAAMGLLYAVNTPRYRLCGRGFCRCGRE